MPQPVEEPCCDAIKADAQPHRPRETIRQRESVMLGVSQSKNHMKGAVQSAHIREVSFHRRYLATEKSGETLRNPLHRAPNMKPRPTPFGKTNMSTSFQPRRFPTSRSDPGALSSSSTNSQACDWDHVNTLLHLDWGGGIVFLCCKESVRFHELVRLLSHELNSRHTANLKGQIRRE